MVEEAFGGWAGSFNGFRISSFEKLVRIALSVLILGCAVDRGKDLGLGDCL
jgi:hypothetical protein